ncbi:MAG: hypothetical protein ACKVT0_14335 [Planctomycetaceae bacterium]
MSFLVEPHVSQEQNSELLALWSRNLPVAGSARQEWLYDSGSARNWFLRNAAGECIGSAGLMRRRMKVGGRQFAAGQTVDLNVDAGFRSVGPALSLQRHLAAQLGDYARGLLYGVPGPQAMGVLNRVGYRPVGVFERWAKPLRTYDKLKSHIAFPALGRAAAFAVDYGLALKSRDFWLRLPSQYAVEKLSRFDERFDRLWEKGSSQFPIVGERTSEYLQWRFGDNPDRQFDILALVSAQSREILGYVVSHVINRKLTIADLFFVDIHSLDWTLTAFLKMVRRQPIDLVTMVYLGSSALTDRLKAFGFYRRPFERQLLILPDSTELSADVFDDQNWYFTKADSDVDV